MSFMWKEVSFGSYFYDYWNLYIDTCDVLTIGMSKVHIFSGQLRVFC